MGEAMQWWIFTFPLNSMRRRRFVRFFGTYESARKAMVARFGWKWAFQYASEEAAGVAEHGLTELEG